MPKTIMRAGRLILLASWSMAFSTPGATAFAQGETNTVQQQITETDAAGLLVEAGRLEDAKRVLAHVLESNPNDNQAYFLRGLIAVAEKNYDAAIEDFRRILATEPDRERARLELARAFFLKGDYDNAERNFRFARAGDLTDDAKRNIDQFLAAIARLKTWSYDVGLGAADDTNVNGATSVRQVDIYGLPFTLSDNARQKSGIGVVIDGGGEWSPLVSENWKARLGGRVHRVEYGGNAFDDMTLSAYAGPQYLLPRWRIDTLVTGFRRWYGNTPYNDGIGGRVSVGFAFGSPLQFAITLDAQNVSYRNIVDQNGAVYAGNGEMVYTFSPSRFVRLAGGVAVQHAKARALASTTDWFAIDYYQDLPLGFSVNVEPAFAWTDYDAPLPAFGVTRSDNSWAVRLDVLNRRLEFAGFAPRISLIHIDQKSNIPLYRFSRDQVQLGLTRQF